MWNIAKLASGTNDDSQMARQSLRKAWRMGLGCNSRDLNASWNSGEAMMRSRANSATTLTEKATKNG